MSTNTISLSDSTSDTPVSSHRSMSCESIIDMNHNNNWQKIARRLSFTDEALNSRESQLSSQQSSSNDELTDENTQQTIDHEQHTETMNVQSSVSKQRPSWLRLLKMGNVCQSSRKSRQPVIVLDQLTKKYKIRVIDYSTWNWQPKIQLQQLTDDELKNVDRSLLQPNHFVQNHISPIKFDRDEELIRELSPDTAIKRFQEVIVFILFNSLQFTLYECVFFSFRIAIGRN